MIKVAMDSKDPGNGEDVSEKFFSCTTCAKNLKKESPSEDNDASDKNEACRECGRKPSQKLSIVSDKPSNEEETFACDLCGREFNRKCNLIIHFRIHSGEKDYECWICGRKFAHKNSLTVHYRVHTGEKKYSCDICQRKFAHSSNLKAHIKTHESKKRSFKCEQCGEVFNRKCSLMNHNRGHHTGLGFINDDTLMEYGEYQNTQDDRHYACKLCEKRFKKRVHLKNHLKIHLDGKRFGCDYCGKKFRQRNHLVVHLTIHTGDRKYACSDCGKRFSQRSHLRVHIRSHTGEKNFECGECGKKFGIKSHLNCHIRMHTGEKKYMCDICGKRYTQNSALTCHLKQHVGDMKDKKRSRRRRRKVKSEPLECDFCGENFRSKYLMKKHVKICEMQEDQSDLTTNDHLHTQLLENIGLNSVVQEMQNVINNILPLRSLAANTGVVKTENIPEEVQNYVNKNNSGGTRNQEEHTEAAELNSHSESYLSERTNLEERSPSTESNLRIKLEAIEQEDNEDVNISMMN